MNRSVSSRARHELFGPPGIARIENSAPIDIHRQSQRYFVFLMRNAKGLDSDRIDGPRYPGRHFDEFQRKRERLPRRHPGTWPETATIRVPRCPAVPRSGGTPARAIMSVVKQQERDSREVIAVQVTDQNRVDGRNERRSALQRPPVWWRRNPARKKCCSACTRYAA